MAKMRRRRTGGFPPELSIINPSKGINTFMADIDIDDLEASDLLNIEFSEKGNPGKRRGSTVVGNEVDSRGRGLASFYRSNGDRFLLRASGTKLYRLVGTTWTEITGVTFTNNLQTNFVQAKDAVYIHNGTDDMAKFNGTTLNQPATGVKAKFGVYYNSYHIISGNPSFPSRLYISNINNADDFTGQTGTATASTATSLTDSSKSWGVNDFADQIIRITEGTGVGQEKTITANTATTITVASTWSTNPDTTSKYKIGSGNFIDIAKDDGDKITGLGKFQDFLIIFKERSIYQLFFDQSGVPTVLPVTSGVGCVSHRSIDNMENDLLFLSRVGSNVSIRVLGNEPNFFNVIRTNELSTRIQPILSAITASNLENCSAIYDDNKYMLAIPYGGVDYNNRIVVYDRRYMAFSIWEGMNVNYFNQFVDSQNASHLYFIGDNDGKMYEMYQGFNDDGAAINAYWQSKNYNLGAFDVTKRWNDCTLLLRRITGTLQLTITLDGTDIVKNVTIGSSAVGSTGFGTGLFGTRLLGEGAGVTSVAPSSSNVVKRTRINKPAINVKLRVSNNVVDESFSLMGFNFTYRPFGHNKFNSQNRI
jgi:hypothetical protein